MLLQFPKKHSSIATILTIWKCPKIQLPLGKWPGRFRKNSSREKNTLSSQISAMENGTFDGPCVTKKAKRCDQGGALNNSLANWLRNLWWCFLGWKIRCLAEITLISAVFLAVISWIYDNFFLVSLQLRDEFMVSHSFNLAARGGSYFIANVCRLFFFLVWVPRVGRPFTNLVDGELREPFIERWSISASWKCQSKLRGGLIIFLVISFNKKPEKPILRSQKPGDFAVLRLYNFFSPSIKLVPLLILGEVQYSFCSARVQDLVLFWRSRARFCFDILKWNSCETTLIGAFLWPRKHELPVNA